MFKLLLDLFLLELSVKQSLEAYLLYTEKLKALKQRLKVQLSLPCATHPHAHILVPPLLRRHLVFEIYVEIIFSCQFLNRILFRLTVRHYSKVANFFHLYRK